MMIEFEIGPRGYEKFQKLPAKGFRLTTTDLKEIFNKIMR